MKGPAAGPAYFEAEGFTFDMGPSWYWMPDVFEQYFARFGQAGSRLLRSGAPRPLVPVIFGDQDFRGYSGRNDRAAGHV